MAKLSEKASWELPLAVLIAGLGGWLRFVDLGLMEFKGDEAAQIALALSTLGPSGRPLGFGIVSSIGVHTSPFFPELVALAMRLALHPTILTALVIGVPATLALLLGYYALRPYFGPFITFGAISLQACAFWPVLYARKLWPQSLLPVFTVVLVALLLGTDRERSRWRSLAIPFALAVMFHVHFSAVTLVLPSFVVLLARRGNIAWRAVLFGAILGAATWLPYGYLQAGSSFVELRDIESRPSSSSPAASRDSWLAPLVYAAKMGGADPEYALGGSRAEFWRESGTAALVLSTISSVTFFLLFTVGLLSLVAGARRRGGGFWATPWSVVVLCLGGHLLTCGVIQAAGVRLFPHYFIVLGPLPFLTAAWSMERLHQDVTGLVRPLVSTVCMLVLLGSLSTLQALRTYVWTHGGTAGDYGEYYCRKADLATRLARDGGVAPAGEVGILVELVGKWNVALECSLR